MREIRAALIKARALTLSARERLWEKRGEHPNLTAYNDAQKALDTLEGIIWRLEHWKEETCEKS